MHLVDTHAHLTAENFTAEESALALTRARDAGVVTVVNVGTDLATSREVVELAAATDHMYATVGVHPHEAAVFADDAIVAALRDLAAHPRVVAIGECGLDYHYDHAPRDLQRTALRRQIELATELGKPLVLHNRESDDDLLAILSEVGVGPAGGVVHAFSTTVEVAQACLDLGLHLGFGGMVTFKSADGIRAAMRATPLDRILLETDTPYLTPTPHRGQRNEPMYVRLVADRIAEERGVSIEAVAEVTTANARRLFAIS